MEGFVNLDQATNGWRFEHGLDYPDASVDAVTISHSLMYVAESRLPDVFADIYRVLVPGGVFRVTEDNTEDEASERYGGWVDAVTLTGPVMMRQLLKDAGFSVRKQKADTTGYTDQSLLQTWHGREPKVFFLEGRKP